MNPLRLADDDIQYTMPQWQYYNSDFARNHLNTGAVDELLEVAKADDVMVHVAPHLIPFQQKKKSRK
jgi:hypothetical protein